MSGKEAKPSPAPQGIGGTGWIPSAGTLCPPGGRGNKRELRRKETATNSLYTERNEENEWQTWEGRL